MGTGDTVGIGEIVAGLANHEIAKDQQIADLRAELAQTNTYWEECQVEHHKRNMECKNLKKRVAALEGVLKRVDESRNALPQWWEESGMAVEVAEALAAKGQYK